MKKGTRRRVKIYDRLVEVRAEKNSAETTGGQLRKFGGFYTHVFKADDAEIFGNPDGSLTIRSRSGKRLWS